MKKVFLIVVAMVTLLAIPVTVFLAARSSDLRTKAAPATTLALSPAAVSKKVGDTFNMEVVLDPGSNQVVATELHIVFDPTKIEAQTITNGPLFPSILTSGVVDRGTASITVGAADARRPVKESGTAAVIRFKALERTDTPVSIKFASNTFVGSFGETTNVLVGSSPASVTITGDGAAATTTPTKTPTLTPTSSPAPTTTASATLTLTPTPTATQSAVATSSALVILKPTDNASTNVDTPTFTGKAPPGATVTITIYSTPQTVVVTADANGNWTYTPTTALESGPHSVVASATNSTGQQLTATTSFVVASGASSASQSATPIAGNELPTLLFIGAGILLLASGIAVPIFAR